MLYNQKPLNFIEQIIEEDLKKRFITRQAEV